MEDQKLSQGAIKEIGCSTETFTYTGKLSGIELNILYSLMLLRISNGYTQDEVSFLMGYEENIVSDIEELRQEGIGLGTVYQFMEAVEKTSMKGIMLSELTMGDSEPDFKLIKVISKEIIEFSMFVTEVKKPDEMVFKFYESNPAYIRFELSYEETMREIKGILEVMLQGFMFDEPQSPSMLYRRCSIVCGSELYPRHLKTALNDMLSKRSNPKLVRRKSRRDGTISYEKITK